MKYLLDTHTFIWLLFEPKKLSSKVSTIIMEPENTIYVSLITFWEISLKYNLGKISLKNVVPDDLPGYAKKSGIEILELEADIVSSFHKLPVDSHKDPFDRLIIWQCIHKGITLLTKDSEISQYEKYHLKTIWS